MGRKTNHWLCAVFIVHLGIFYTSVLALTYDLEALCQRNEVWPTFQRVESGKVRVTTKRRFGSLLEVRSGETLVVILGNEDSMMREKKETSPYHNDSDHQTTISVESNMTNIITSTSATETSPSIDDDGNGTFVTSAEANSDNPNHEMTGKDQKNRTRHRFNWKAKLKKDFDCLFGIKSFQIGTNLTLEVEWWGVEDSECNNYMQIHRAYENFFVQLSQRGSYVIASPGFIPLHIRVSLCKKNNPDLGLVLVATSTVSDSASQSSVSYIYSFVAPTILLLIIVGASMSCCCCASPWQRFRQWRSRDEDDEEEVSPATAPVSPSVLRTPSASRTLFPHLTLSSSSPHRDKPPSYDELFPAGGSDSSSKRAKPKRAATHAEEPPPSYENLSFEHEGPS